MVHTSVMHQLAFITAAAALGTAPVHASAATIHVPGGAPTIQVAINIASSGDEIVVAPGIYFEAINLNGKTLNLHSSGGPEATIIDAFGQFTPVVRIISGEGANTVIEGFTLRNGVATGTAPGERGGGMYCNLTSPTIRNCIFTMNSANIGGAFYANGGLPKVENCQFIENEALTANGDGGAVYLNGTTINFTDCQFTGNVAGRLGGAMRLATASGVYLRCTFEQNDAGLNGGAIDMAGGGTPSLTFRDCLFVGNIAGNNAGAVQLATPLAATVSWINCIFRANHATMAGAAMNIIGRGDIINCTFYGNTANSSDLNAGAIRTESNGNATVRNCIVRSNLPSGIAGNITTTYTCNQTTTPGTGNISVDPLFVNPSAGDFRLTASSPCIDAANTVALPGSVSTDFEGLARALNAADMPSGVAVLGYFADMGALEFQPESSCPPNTCPADVAPDGGDGLVNVNDLLRIINSWGACP